MNKSMGNERQRRLIKGYEQDKEAQRKASKTEDRLIRLKHFMILSYQLSVLS
jgi:hypothetical protein